MAGDEHVGEGEQAGEHVVLDDLVGQVLEEEIRLLLVDVEGEAADLAGFEAGDDRLGIDSAPRLVLMSITPACMRASAARR